LNPFLLSALQHYGYFALWLIVFVAAAGAPISGSLLLFAAGAFAALGDLNIFILFPVALSAAVLGDNLTYFIGWHVGAPILDWIARQKRFRWFSERTIERGRDYFRRRTAWAIFITRFLIVVLGGAINLLAGLERYPYQKYLFWDVCGQILSVIISLGLGFAFAASWEEVAGIFGAFSTLVLVLLIVAGIAGLLIREMRRRRRARTAASASEIQLQGKTEETPELTKSPVAQESGPLLPNDVGDVR
jgi:membrane-associated protein